MAAKMLKRFAMAGVIVLAAIGITVSAPVAAFALSNADFNPGYIISDTVFYNSGAMSQAQIQAFLVAQEPTCPAANGMPCLRNYTQTTYTRAAASAGQCAAYPGADNEPASQIIARVAQACGINPQVLLVTLQKEQSLVTASSPTPDAYRSATGYYCPDSAACNAKYYGFYNQVYSAAWQYKEYSIGNFNYHIGLNSIAYSPSVPCGAGPVNIVNQATANLYDYTPYQPKDVALNYVSGPKPACASFGNLNFWRTFNNWFGSSTGGRTPIGNVEIISGSPGHIRVGGWAFDPDTAAPIPVDVYVNNVGTRVIANESRPDVASAYGIGPLHGFDATLPAEGSGPQVVCIYGINNDSGPNVLFKCATLQVMTGSPIGIVDTVAASMGKISVSGWAFDPDTANSIPVQVSVDSVATTYTASQSRPDIATGFPGYGAAHGFSATVNASAGNHTVCVTAVNAVAPGSNSSLGCRVVNMPGGSPIGIVDTVKAQPGSFIVTGWAFDPDSAVDIPVHIYNGTAGVAYMANKSRPDVGLAFPGYGDTHGFSETIPAHAGANAICVYAINIAGSGGNPVIGCRTVTGMSGSPIGVLDSVTASSAGLTIAGWTFDPDSINPISIRATVDGKSSVYAAGGNRPDIARAFPPYGAAHGFVQQIAVTAGKHQVCVYAENTGPGAETSLGCASVTN